MDAILGALEEIIMETMNIAVTSALKEFVQRRVEAGGYGSVSEYFRELVRLDQKQAAQASLENELLLGLASGPAEKLTKKEWSRIRAEVRQLASTRKKR
jgi:antitoxin ParD1/3/4